MSRVKHLIMLIFKLVFIAIVCAATMVMMSMQTYQADEIPIAQSFNESNIDVKLQNGASLDWEIVNNELVFEITQSGENFNDIVITLFFSDIKYDSSFIRSLLGKDIEKHEEFISEMEKGPWLAHFNFCLKGESFFTTNRGKYTFSDNASNDYVNGILSSGANTTSQTDSFSINSQSETVMMKLTFGSEDSGALENGKYTLKADLKLGHPEGKQLDVTLLEQAIIVLKFAGKAISEAGWKVFNVTNWLVFYGVMVILGWFIYLWRDVKSMIRIFFALLDGEGTVIIVKTYINGIYQGEHTEYSNGSRLLVALVITMLCYVLFVVTIPIRILIHIIRDFIYLFIEDYEIEAFSFLGNFLGSIGIYALIVGFVGLMSANYLIGGIAAVLGIALCIAAHFICKHREEEYG